jgi:hypothetical protein
MENDSHEPNVSISRMWPRSFRVDAISSQFHRSWRESNGAQIPAEYQQLYSNLKASLDSYDTFLAAGIITGVVALTVLRRRHRHTTKR